jgi:transposase
MTQEEAAEHFDVGSATVYRWLALKRETGSVAPRPHGGGFPAAFDDDDIQVVREVVAEKPDRTLAELTKEICARLKITVSESAVVRALKRLELTLKKKSSRRANRIDRTSRSAAKSSSPRSTRSIRRSSHS